MFHQTLTLLLLLLLFVAPAIAQETSTKISASLYAFAYSPGQESVFLPTGSAYEEIRLSTANIVGPVTCVVTEGKLTLHSAPVTGDDGKPTHPVIASGNISNDIRKALVVLFPLPKGDPMKYRCIVLNHDLTDFPLGVYRLINFSNKPVRGAIGKEIVRAEPGGIANLTLKGESGSIVPVRFEYYQEKRWNLLTETRAAVRDDRRWLMCIYQDPASQRMNIRSIPDRTKVIPAPETDAP